MFEFDSPQKWKFHYQSVWKVVFRDDDTVEVTPHNGKAIEGTWTMIYDEGFIVRVPHF